MCTYVCEFVDILHFLLISPQIKTMPKTENLTQETPLCYSHIQLLWQLPYKNEKNEKCRGRELWSGYGY